MLKNKLKEIRLKEYMMNSREFAEMLEVKESTYCRWEKCDNNPNLELAYKIAEKLNKSVTDIWYQQ